MATFLASIIPQGLHRATPSKHHREKQLGSSTLNCHLSTPSTIILDESDASTSLISGQFLLDVRDEELDIENLYAVLNTLITLKKTKKKGCKACRNKIITVNRWDFAHNLILERNTHHFPFFYQVPQHLDSSMNTPLISISYELEAVVTARTKGQSQFQTLRAKHILDVQRAFPVPSLALSSTRIFPSPGIEMNCQFGPEIDPSGSNRVALNLHGLLSCPQAGGRVEIWRLWKGAWQLEEKIRTSPLGCSRHDVGTDTQTHKSMLGKGEFYTSGESDMTSDKLNTEFDFSIQKKLMKPQPRYNLDTGKRSNFEATHSLAVELVLVKEHYPAGRPDRAIRTGVGRILRSEHPVVLNQYTRVVSGDIEGSNLPSYEDSLWPPEYSGNGDSL